MQIFSPFEGLAILAGYAAVVSAFVWFFSRGFVFSKASFLVANREISKSQAAPSIAASWVWAPALFLGAQMAYDYGWVGVFWFLVPNVLCLILFSFFAKRIRELFPDGFTLSGYMRECYTKRVQNVYLFALIGLAMCSFAVQLLAGGKIISSLTGLPYFWVTVLLALIPIGYSMYSGLKASILSDLLQLGVIYVVGGAIVIWAIVAGGGFETVQAGLGGKEGVYTDLFSNKGLYVFYTFGLPTTIGLLSGPFGDQSFWERMWAIRKPDVQSSFVIAAFLFGVVPLMLSLLGFLAAGMHAPIKNPQQVNMEIVILLLPVLATVLFLGVLLSGLVGTLDSRLASIASIGGHDLLMRVRGDKGSKSDVRFFSKGAMLVLIVGGIAIANIPGLTLVYLFVFYGTLRSSTLLPTVITLLRKNRSVSEAGIFWGVIVSLVVGLPIFAYGKLENIVPMIIGGSLFTVLASGVIVLLFSAYESRKRAETGTVEVEA
jgi:Na+/proline symporter